MNVLWTKYFIANDPIKTDHLWQTYLNNVPRIMFQKIIHTARETQNEDLIRRLTEHLKVSNVTQGAIGNAYSCYLDVLVAKNKIEEAVEIFEKALTLVPIENINRTAILRVRDVYAKLGRPFNHEIPSKNRPSETQGHEDF